MADVDGTNDSRFAQVAWIPDDDPERDWEVAASAVAAWVDQRCRSEGASGVLVTNAINQLGVEALDWFERSHARTSRRAGRQRVGRGRSPVFSYVPHAEDLDFAMGLARGSSLGVVETISFPLEGWARHLGAVNLLTGSAAPPLPDEVQGTVDRLKFYGNNSFADSFGSSSAQRILRDVDPAFVALLPSAVLAAGVRASGAIRLQRMLDPQVGRRRR